MMATTHSMIQVSVYESTLPSLLAMKQSTDESIADVIQRITKDVKQQEPKLAPKEGQEKEGISKAQYQHEVLILDSVVGADSFGELYGKLIDVLSDVAEDAVEKLACMRARSRRYVSTNQRHIHPSSPHLPTLKTKSGWYVSKNVGFKDFLRGVRALCNAAGIEYGKDIRFQR